jgi:hypothetical protein
MEDNNFFRDLTPEEEADFRAWANKNYTPGTTIQEVWHPVVREVCHQMNRSARQPKVRVCVTKMDGTVLDDYEITPALSFSKFPSVPVAATDIELSNDLEDKIRRNFDILDDLYWEAQKDLEEESDSENN